MVKSPTTWRNLLITGQPGIGKTTLVRTLANHLQDLHPMGFYTQEMRRAGTRVGFEIIGLDGRQGILAHIGIQSPSRVGKYGVDVAGFESFLAGLSITGDDSFLVIIDEIGKMECYSPKFRTIVDEILDSERALLATISAKGNTYIEGIKRRDDVKVYQLTKENRDTFVVTLVSEIRQMVR